MAKVKICETVIRDAHQSLIATRMTTEEMLPILEQMDKALKASWQTVAQNMNIVRLLLITRQPSENTQALLSRSEAMMKELMQVKGLTTDTYALGYLRPGNDMTVCRVEVKPEAMPEVLMRLTALNGVLLSLIVHQLTIEAE